MVDITKSMAVIQSWITAQTCGTTVGFWSVTHWKENETRFWHNLVLSLIRLNSDFVVIVKNFSIKL